MSLASFRELIVWRKSFVLARSIYGLTKDLPKNEQYGLVSQIRRCSISIPSNIAEGQQRNNLKEYRQFLGIARGSAAELETQLLLAQDIYGIRADQVLSDLDEVQKMLQAMLRKLQPIT